jgi:hypothetical protein
MILIKKYCQQESGKVEEARFPQYDKLIFKFLLEKNTHI